ncbi:hypothetical protein F157LOC_03318 [Pectobacterium brasiliense]|uniref:DUF4238 domain-containing protein n=1 Tax=Pectobacterium brasiliense TaxID=180957 RepID=UPI000CE6925F|nr:DUF4238 domain-containing protein [Pectobacterium brasiliense]PPE57772.1 hypothetical protein F157LOC_03318 [Pectobacterium brasiliense]
MAGKRQHFIPRFLQRGFATERGGKYFSSFCNKEKIKENVIIENIGVENYFYSVDGDYLIDEKITNSEIYEYSSIHKMLLNNPCQLGENNSSSLAGFIAHLESRTRHVRVSFINSSSYLIDTIFSKLKNRDTLYQYLENTFFSNPEKIHSLFNENMMGEDIPPHFHNMLKEVLYHNYDKWLPEVISNMADKILPVLHNEMPTILIESAKKGHVNSFADEVSPRLKAKEYEKLKYKIIKVDEPLILGDSIVFFEVNSERGFKPYCDKNDILEAIYFPLDEHTLLYGFKNEDNPRIKNINTVISQCSLDFFIFKEKFEEVEVLQKQIGTNAHLLTHGEIDLIIESILSSYRLD